MSRFKNITGKKHGRLTAIEHIGFSVKNNALWRCSCDCGNFLVVEARLLNGVGTKSCGCILRDKNRSRPIRNSTNLKHGHTSQKTGRTKEYIVWFSIKQRCMNPKNSSYKYYGAKGVKICDRWLDFENFLSDVGFRPSKDLSIDRIDPFGNYEPGNVRWATREVQGRNKRNAKIIIFDAQEMSVSDASKKLSVPEKTLYNWERKNKDITSFYAIWAKRRSRAISLNR